MRRRMSAFGGKADIDQQLQDRVSRSSPRESRCNFQEALSGGFKDRDLYVLCANASDGVITVHPTHKGRQLKSFPLGQEVMRTASEGKVSEVTYPWPRPGSIKPLEKHTFYTKSEIRFAASAITNEEAFGATRMD
jgi:hypothetical protein